MPGIEQGTELRKLSEKKVSDLASLHARYACDDDFRVLVDGLIKVLRTGLLNAYDLDVAAELAEQMDALEGDDNGREE